KQWMRVATPALYDCVILRSQSQADSFAAALRSTPSLGKCIRKLRIEGGFGDSMHSIIVGYPNICDFLITLEV
ncbi:hypothetical protein BDV98DRAFT_484600, partial [Pterulicium gracile]